MTSYPIAEAKAHFSDVIKMVEKGEPVAITRGAKKEEVAVVVSMEQWQKKQKLKIGSLEHWGGVTFADDWYMTDEELLNS